MPGFDNGTCFADNVDFTGNSTVTPQMNMDGQLLIGSSVAPHIRAQTPASGNNITFSLGQGTLGVNLTGTTNHSVQVGNATGSLTSLAVATTGTVLAGATGADPSFTATPSVTSITIANVPSAGTDGTNKDYVDSIASGFTFKTSAYAATTANLNAVYVNGVAGVGATLTNAGALAAFSVDGVSPPINSRILVKNQTSQLENGIYTLTTVGSGAVAWILTRATDYDAPSEIIPGSIVGVLNGTVNGSTFWVQTATVTTVGVDSIVFVQFSSPPITTTQYDVLVGGPSNSVVSVGPGSVGQILQSGGNAANPAYSTATYPSTATGTGQILRANGTNFVVTTATYPTTTTISQLLYSSSNNVINGLNTANNGTLVTDGSGVPSISSTLPSAVQANITAVGTIASGVWNGTTIDVAHGGTGRTSLTNHGVLVGASTSAITQLVAGSAGQVLQSGGASADPSYSTATYPSTAGSSGNVLTSNGTNWVSSPASGGTVTSVSGTAGRITSTGGTTPVIDIDAAYVGQASITTLGTVTSGTWNATTIDVANGGTGRTSLTNHGVLVGASTTAITQLAAGTAGQVLQSGGASADPAYSTATYPATAGTSGKVLISDGTNIVSSTPTFPNASATSGKFIQSDGTNWIASTPTLPATAGTSGKVLVSDGTNFVSSTPTFPNASATSGKFIRSDGTNWIASTPTLPTSAGTSGKILQSDGTNYVESTPTYPSTSGTSRKIIVSDGTNNVYSTETWATPSTSGNVLTSNGTNWVSSPPTNVPSTANSIYTLVEDFMGNNGSASGSSVFLTPLNNGGTKTQQNMTAGHPGVVTFDSGLTLSTNAYRQGTTDSPPLILGGGTFTVIWYLKIPTLSSGTQRFTIECGVSDIIAYNDTVANGVYFLYSDNLNSGAWQLKTTQASTTTTTNSSSTADTNWHSYKIVVNAAGNSVSFYIDGTEVANSPVATNIPTVNPVGAYVRMTKTVGTSQARTFLVDLCSIQYDLTAAR